MEEIRPTPEYAEWQQSFRRERCVRCKWARFKSDSNWFIQCRRLKRWTLEDYVCKYYNPYPPKKRKRGNCEYEIEDKVYSHPKNCEKCLMNPETCGDSPQYNANWKKELKIEIKLEE